MKKFLSIFLVLTILITCVACGKTEPTNADSTTTTESTTESTTKDESTTESVSEDESTTVVEESTTKAQNEEETTIVETEVEEQQPAENEVQSVSGNTTGTYYLCADENGYFDCGKWSCRSLLCAELSER